LSLCTAIAQKDSLNNFNTKKWIFQISNGYGWFTYKGLLPSRNEINYNQTKNIAPPASHGNGNGYVFDAKFGRKISKNFIGVNANKYSYYDAWTDGDVQNIQSQDSILSYRSVYNNQDYLNVGLFYQREISTFLKNRLAVNIGLSGGYSFNLTLERTEYDYYEKGFVIGYTSSSNEDFFLASTEFKNGYFLNPFLNVKYNITKNTGFVLECSPFFQWNKYKQNYFSAKDADLFYIENSYSIKGIQFRLGYFF